MNKDRVRKCVFDSLRETLGKDGGDVVISDQTNPIRGLGLKSDDGVDFACTLSDKLGFEIEHAINPFVDDDGKRARSVGQIVSLVCELAAAQKEVSNA